ncbi:MAG: nucleotidyltransferase [Spirochaetaceae bacterium]|nr:MAG: nucleotidyltransferase [Spirochaetaceae bacterium]
MDTPDVRWKQRFSNFSNSVDNLEAAVAIQEPNTFERQGLIKAFELAYELAWKTLQDYLRDLGIEDIVGPKPVIRRAFSDGIINDGLAWQEMHQARNESAHLYDEARAQSIEQAVRQDFASLLRELRDTMKTRYGAD